MLQNLLNNKFKIVQFLLLMLLLALIRGFENELFYDPFLKFFKSENNTVYPDFDSKKLFINLFFRYSLNAIISLVILYVIFSEIAIVKFSAILYCVFFVILIFLFFIYFTYFDESHKMIVFYIRRFLIQPIFLMLFIPAYYYQKKIK
jgi:exosortase F-associated protein